MVGKRALRICLLLVVAIAATGCGRLQNANKCGSANPDTRIAGCTALIQQAWLTPQSLSVVYSNRGTAYDAKREYDRAILDINEAIRLNPRYASAWYDGAVAYVSRGIEHDKTEDYGSAIQDYDEAIQDFNQAVHLSPNSAAIWYSGGRAYDARGTESDNRRDYGRAIQAYSRAIHLSPRDAVIYRYRGLAYNQEGDYDRAILDLDEAIRLNPKDAIAWIVRGAAWGRMGDYDRATKDFDDAIRIYPKDPVAYGARGGIYLLQSDLTPAIADFERAIADAGPSRLAIGEALMLHVAMKRQGRDDSHQLARVAAAADLSKWPGPLLKLDLGQMTPGEVMAAAANPGTVRQKWHVCEANYFIGEDALFHNHQATALARFKAARDGCPTWDFDYSAALVELKRLGVPLAHTQRSSQAKSQPSR